MTNTRGGEAAEVTSWAQRAADRSPSVQRSRDRSLARAKQIVEAARRLVPVKGADFTIHELVKEAGIAIQTFYKHFAGKDQVLLAVIEDMVAEAAAALREQAPDTDPVARLRFYVLGVVEMAGAGGFDSPNARFVTAQHWRLQQQYSDELTAATRPVTVLLLEALRDASAEGLLAPVNPEYDAWLASQLIMSVFHHYAFAKSDDTVREVAERIWMFCYAAWGGRLAAETGKRSSRRQAG
jgi:AcrR family transcriptional regulator